MLEAELVNRTLSVAMRTGADFAEIFAEDRRSSSAILDDGRVEEVVSGRDRGAGIRVVVGETTGFAHTADLTETGLAAAAGAAAAAARQSGGARRIVEVSSLDVPRPLTVRVPPEDVPKSTKVALLTAADAAARSTGSAITQVSARYGDGRRRILVADSDGLFTSDDQVRTLFSVSLRGLGRHRHADGPRGRRAAPPVSSCSTSTTWRRWPAGPPNGP